MSHWPFRFVHAADLHLEQPPQGVADLPEHLRELFVESAYWAAERVFEVALSEEADLLILAGDVLHPARTGPRGPLFLAEQFERLNQRGIAVYWAGGRVDSPEAWPSCVRLPPNVHYFAPGTPQDITQQRQGVPLVRVVGASREGGRKVRAADFLPDPAGLYSIAVVHGGVNAEVLKSRGIDYWALGGNHGRSTSSGSPRVAHYPGTPQGRQPDQTGPHGCTLASVDDQRRTRLTFIPCDALRWQNERVAIDETTTRPDLETRLRGRVESLQEANPGVELLISWTVAGESGLLAEIRRGRLGANLLEMLRAEFGSGSPAAWSISLIAEPPALLPTSWYEPGTIRGDYLGELRRYQAESDLEMSLDALVAEEHRESLRAAIALTDAAERELVLREAAMLGVDLLSGEETQS